MVCQHSIINQYIVNTSFVIETYKQIHDYLSGGVEDHDSAVTLAFIIAKD